MIAGHQKTSKKFWEKLKQAPLSIPRRNGKRTPLEESLLADSNKLEETQS